MSGYTATSEELTALAKHIISVDNDTQGTLRNVRNTVSGLQGIWVGAAANAFNQLMERFDTDAMKLQEALRAIAEQMDSSAVAYAQQEEEATQLSSSIANRL
ncbi:WXG100 family type VII secretion target [Lentzea sp. CC55]|uniref:WXG100 family type VII secretion target n=1 Tax=Lentzea sp. CC55 TaxID=2884909 RepID=UPI001F1EC087|nr:WXG100 family type VII secretion target [Lentzea sp. CC55]MCG8921146.1 WXG100 family type VII secretion target [Lentzea sp. CC55]